MTPPSQHPLQQQVLTRADLFRCATETGLAYFRARYLDAELGRFLGRDPVQAGHRYGYVDNRPASHLDPSGMVAECPPAQEVDSTEPGVSEPTEWDDFSSGPFVRPSRSELPPFAASNPRTLLGTIPRRSTAPGPGSPNLGDGPGGVAQVPGIGIGSPSTSSVPQVCHETCWSRCGWATLGVCYPNCVAGCIVGTYVWEARQPYEGERVDPVPPVPVPRRGERVCRCTIRYAPSDVFAMCPPRVYATGTNLGRCQEAAKLTAPVECRRYYGHCGWLV
jgi:hypothetical protein